MSGLDPSSIAVYAAYITGGLFGLVMLLNKFLVAFKQDKTEGQVLKIMHEELERMSIHNTTLSTELNKLQIEILALNTQLRTLTMENQKLHAEVVTLTAEVTRLQTTLMETKTNVSSGKT